MYAKGQINYLWIQQQSSMSFIQVNTKKIHKEFFEERTKKYKEN